MVNGVSFRAGAMDSAKDILNQPQTHSKPQSGQSAQTGATTDEFVKPKKHGVRNAIIGTLAAAAVVIGGLVAGHRMGKFTKLVGAASAEGAKGFTKFAGKMAGYAETAGKSLNEWGVAGWKAVTGLFNKGAKAATEVTETVA